MKHWLLALCGALLMPFAAHAQEATTKNAPAKFDRGLLWKISMPGKAASFLFGTLHVNDEAVLALPPEVEAAFSASTVFAGELVLDGTDTSALQLAMLSSRPDLPALLGAADWPKVDGLLSLRRFPAPLRAHLRPWAALVVLLKPEQSSGKDVLDVMLQRRARLAGKGVIGLETAEEQIAALSGMPLEAQVMLLREAVSTTNRLEADTAAITRYYLAGDLSAAWSLHLETRSSDPKVRQLQDALSEALIAARNRLFVERMMPLINEGGVFVAVGALHLHGEQGVPALLKARGAGVERVR